MGYQLCVQEPSALEIIQTEHFLKKVCFKNIVSSDATYLNLKSILCKAFATYSKRYFKTSVAYSYKLV